MHCLLNFLLEIVDHSQYTQTFPAEVLRPLGRMSTNGDHSLPTPGLEDILDSGVRNP